MKPHIANLEKLQISLALSLRRFLPVYKSSCLFAQLLLNHRASADIKNDDDRTTLHMASLHGHDAIIPDLVNRDRSIINSGDEEANSALHLAAIGGNLNCVSV